MAKARRSAGGLVVGLIGQPCSGKSALRRFLEELGAEAVDADELVRGLYEEPEVREAVVRLLGPEVQRADGSIDRRRVADRVFADRALLDRLTRSVIWPRTGERLQRRIAQFRARGTGILVLDAPTLLEAGRADWADVLVWVEAPWSRRRAWAEARGWDEHELKRREAALLPEEQKRARAEFVIRNEGSLEELRAAAQRLWQELVRLAGSRQANA